MKQFPSCVTPVGRFGYGIHKPSYAVKNLRLDQKIEPLGTLADLTLLDNAKNFPETDVVVDTADWIFEIPNAFPFRGATFIDKEWADAAAANPGRISLPPRPDVSLSATLADAGAAPGLLEQLPAPLLTALATTSTDPEDLRRLARLSCALNFADGGRPTGLKYVKDNGGRIRPVIHNHTLFEAVANNPALPDEYKTAMVLRPGAQGGSEIVGEWPKNERSHVFEYLRRNSYIAGGHYAANMADDAIRYSIDALSEADMQGLRHLYYQRTFIRLAGRLGIVPPCERRPLSAAELEDLRVEIIRRSEDGPGPATLWGWNFGFDYAPTDYRLHASHQQIHQQYALVPPEVPVFDGSPETPVGTKPAFSCGDLVTQVIKDYRRLHERDFFDDYLAAIAANRRMDGRNDREHDLIVWQDERVLLFVPKAQTSQWELQLMAKKDREGQFPGNVVEADTATRASLDAGILRAQKALAGLGARMVTSIEFSKRMGADRRINQPLLYSFLPRLPESPGAFSEAQLRFINGHYPEDFATACRRELG